VIEHVSFADFNKQKIMQARRISFLTGHLRKILNVLKTQNFPKISGIIGNIRKRLNLTYNPEVPEGVHYENFMTYSSTNHPTSKPQSGSHFIRRYLNLAVHTSWLNNLRVGTDSM
jgi:hypothetical protein